MIRPSTRRSTSPKTTTGREADAADCTKQVIRPDPDDAIAQNQGTLTDAFFNDPTGTNLSKIFATKLELDCKAKG